jgi:small nuclear ribonucleoprotein (snRNP)-like protein
MNVAAQKQGQDTGSMAVPMKRGSLTIAVIALAASVCVDSARADEIRLKDGKKLYGVIVGYEENMFKVKTDFGYVLVEKDKIASIIPSAPSPEKAKADNAKKDSKEKTPRKSDEPQAEANSETSQDPDAAESPMSSETKPVSAKVVEKQGKPSPKLVNTAAKPGVPAKNSTSPASAPEIKNAAVSTAPVTTTNAAPLPPKEPDVPANREEIQGNLYINYTHGFKMYKAPSWNLIEEARGALPNAIVAMGTANESTLMVIGKEKTKESLDGASAEVEKRLQDVYSN